MKLFLKMFLLFFLLAVNPVHAATFYGEISRGYQWVPKKNSGYGVYVPQSYDSKNQPVLVFAFGRTSDDRHLTKDKMSDYATVWMEEAENRGCIIVTPYWEPVIVENNLHVEKYFLEILEEIKLMYNISSEKILLAGFGLGAKMAFSLAAFHPDQFSAVAIISRQPMGDPVLDDLMQGRLIGGLKQRKLPPILLIHGENDTEASLAELHRQAEWLTQKGSKVDIKAVSGAGYTYSPLASSSALDWFEKVPGPDKYEE